MYELISILLWVLVMHIFVQITIHISMDFCHPHLCTNDYSYYYGFLSCKYLYEWQYISLWVFIMHISERRNIHIIIGFGHVLLMTIHITIGFRHAHFCTIDYPVPNLFPMRFCKNEIFSCFLDFFSGINIWGRVPWYLYSKWWVLGRL